MARSLRNLLLICALIAPASAEPALGPLPAVPVPKDNPITPAKVELGRILFFDTRLSGDMSTSCASCHDPEMGWGDGYDIAQGYPGSQHWRNGQTILNSAYHSKLHWDGMVSSLEAQAAAAIEGALSGNGNPAMIEERLAQVPEYIRRFGKAFGADRPRYGDALKAIAAFERTIVSKNVPLDRHLLGKKNAISKSARRGLALFKGKAGCVRCHNGPLFSDQDFHATGVPDNPIFKTGALWQIALRYQLMKRGVPEKVYREARGDLGLYFVTKRERDKGKFRTASLRELEHTAPYMHNGVLATLEDVMEFYNRGGGTVPNKSPLLKPLGLTRREKKDLIALLKSLSGEEIIVDPPRVPRDADSKP